MPSYRFSGVNEQNDPASGQLEAPDSKSARETLFARGLRVETLALQELPLEPAAPAAGANPPPRLSAADSLELTAHLAELLKANLPLAPGLRAIAEELPNRALSKTLLELAALLETGMPLDAAIASTTDRLPAYVRGLLAASLSSGRYQEALEDFLETERTDSALRYRLWLTVSYTLALLGAVAAWLLFVAFFLVPQFAGIYKDFKVTLPPLTQVLLRISEARLQILVATLVFALLTALFLRYAGRVAPLSKVLDRMPLVGTVWRYGALARFSNLLAALLEQGVPLPAALEFTATGVGHAGIAEACRDAAKKTGGGTGFAASIAELSQFPAVLVPMLAWGQRLAAVPEALRTAAVMFRRRVEQRTPLASIVLPAMTYLVIVMAVFFVIVALFMPLVKLITALS
jgi:type II secretory pathway component PulF